jgi:hypothetical protein
VVRALPPPGAADLEGEVGLLIGDAVLAFGSMYVQSDD